MDHTAIPSLRRWLMAAMLLVIALVGWTWADAVDDPSRPALWYPVALAVAAGICLGVVGARLRRLEQAGRPEDTAVEQSTTT
ncbi:hypothetical protein Acsp06_32780 [Actinomycetospora sp. NBRC 106375]|uniref:hypothetical protein n=1 Tax=Actinomycetospora sp. NBRC 106375 TaxID=3032207 RepID=UPI0024A4A585|nr:hypothetical protein [Actinomycetospora sp. NBRC 106375]GLZ47093.1 hypothetical protein Acsp06_32780 [Actinomycetospora sp. NBRC 106375]